MEFCVFAEVIKAEVERICRREYRAEVREVAKNNGKVATGLAVSKNDGEPHPVRPVVYLEDFYEACEAGEHSLQEAAGEILARIRACAEPDSFLAMANGLKEFKQVRDRICYRLMDYERNRQFLKQAPFIRYCNLAVTFFVVLENQEETYATAEICWELVKLWKTDLDTLYWLARKNTPRLFPPVVRSMMWLMAQLAADSGEDGWEALERMPWEDPMPLYIVTNQVQKNGAAVMLYDGVLRGLAERLGSDLVILPSSIHEVMVAPYDGTMDCVELEGMVRNVNEMEVAPEEVLSDRVYRYSRATGRVELLSEAGDRSPDRQEDRKKTEIWAEPLRPLFPGYGL